MPVWTLPTPRPGCVTPLPGESRPECPHDQDRPCEQATGARIGVIIADSRTHAMRLGCSGVAIGCAGIPSVIDDRGRSDLFGRKLEVTKRAVADNIASAAELVMGEADECTPAAVIRGIGLPVSDELIGVESIAADECLFMGVFAKSRTSGSVFVPFLPEMPVTFHKDIVPSCTVSIIHKIPRVDAASPCTCPHAAVPYLI